MSENQQIEWKSSWRDEYLKWICGFANAQGGVLEIGRSDDGQVIGVENGARLLEELPNKLRDLLGAVPAPIQIRVYADRLSIWNPGELPESWTAATLLGPHGSQPYNPDIANAFFRAGEIEAWGRGMQRVIEACRQAGTPEPRIRVEARGFWFEFPFSAEYLGSVGSGGEPADRADRTTQERTWLERLGERLGETEGRILLLIRTDPRISTRALAEALGVSTTAMDKTLAKLKKKGALRRVGPARGGHWEVPE